MWTTILTIIKRPTVVAIIVLLLLCGTLYINNARQDVKIAELGTKIAKIELNYSTCKTSKSTLQEAINVCNGQSDAWVASNDALREQITKCYDEVAYWQNLYDNKICFTNEDETPVVPSQGKVVNDVKSSEAVHRINIIFGD